MSSHSRKAMIIRILELQSETMDKFIINFVTLLFLTSYVISDECNKCVQKEKCKEFGTLNADEQKAWEKKYPCKVPDDEEHGKTGLTAAAAGDYVCCPSAVVGFNNNQCTMPSFPPEPETGCCGREASKTNNIYESETPPREDSPRHWGSFFRRWRRSAEEDNANVTIEGFISNGRDTDLEQFPWAVHLRMTFNHGYQQSGSTCGGSLISSQHVVTAAHCVYKPGAELTEVEVYLAEYDKRTSQDCKVVPGHGRKCVTNMVMKAKRVFVHPQYNDQFLFNDIALLRLDGHAPYTNYIRPICLPSVNVDKSFSSLRLAVTGWGDNGPYSFYGSVIKQFTVLNLVPHNTCRHTYSYLSPGQMCAAGNRGEDICAGDSGGPLMIMHRGQYQLVGVVSGKRQDSHCGSNVPSLFTNVHYYRDWINSKIRQ